jgi:hypothetical protein
MKRFIVIVAATLLTVTGASVVTATASSASVCEPNGTGCAKAGIYPGPNAVISNNYAGFKVEWTESVVQPYSSGVPLSWTAYMTYTNISSSTLTLGCPGSWKNASYVSEHMSGGSGDDGTVPAASTTCSKMPGLAKPVPPRDTFTASATFHNVPWPGSAVAITWGNAGTSPKVYPFRNPPVVPSKCGNGQCIWSGWGTSVVKNYTGITGDFQVPTVKGSKNGTVAIWDGLGGTDCNDPLEQTGISASIVNGKAVYRAWWEVIYFNLNPNLKSFCWNKQEAVDNPHYFKQTIRPGDWIRVSVTYSSSPAATGGTYWLRLEDVTRGWSENVPVTAQGINGSTSRDSAEAIVEDFNGGPLPDFGTARPGNIRVYPTPNLDYGWTQQNPTEYHAFSPDKVYVAPISSAGDFTVTWKHS